MQKMYIDKYFYDSANNISFFFEGGGVFFFWTYDSFKILDSELMKDLVLVQKFQKLSLWGLFSFDDVCRESVWREQSFEAAKGTVHQQSRSW